MDNTVKAKLEDSVLNDITLYNNGSLAFFDHLNVLQTVDVVETEFYAVVIVLAGRAGITINNVHYEAHADDIFICPPKNILENCMLSVDFRCHCIAMSPQYIMKIFPLTENNWNLKFLFEKNPTARLSPEETAVFCQYYDLLCSKIHLPSTVQSRVIDTLMQAFVYDMEYILSRVLQADIRPFTSAEQLFKRFIDLLDSTSPKRRDVGYYAARLNITPKYLTAICRETGDANASTIINRYIVRDIETRLRHSSSTIKEIANDLDFPNISFFGKYVRKHFGLSPRQLREKFRKEKQMMLT